MRQKKDNFGPDFDEDFKKNMDGVPMGISYSGNEELVETMPNFDYCFNSGDMIEDTRSNDVFIVISTLQSKYRLQKVKTMSGTLLEHEEVSKNFKKVGKRW